MKKRSFVQKVCIVLLALLCCALSFPALAEEDAQPTASARAAFSISGQVEAGESVSLTAPYGGKVLDYAVRAGDIAQPGESPFRIDTTKVYAPCDGTIGGVRAQAGDETSFIQDRFGALMYLEPDNLLQIDTSTSEAYDKNENKLVHAGETVYLKSVNSSNRTGVGYVTQVDGTSFSVEITESNLRVGERAGIYRTATHENASRIGVGKTARLNPVSITGDGSVLHIPVTEGQSVKRGDVLAETVDGVLPGLTAVSEEGKVSGACIVSSISVQPGEQVSANQVLATLHPLDRLQVAADLNELDLERVKVGDAVLVELTGLKESDLLSGTVTAISALSHTDSGDAEYKVYVAFPVSDAVREGMSATVYLSE